ncbi:MAG: exodeoxyribonuclease VII large subunit [Candidatus Nomurabacteria bacterium]|jgi:exodeoxyribonuclease VII large subunit|nr:exodeoxyribonuclease VII large subunit [Candidatus Nomurabacteria bacterium]
MSVVGFPPEFSVGDFVASLNQTLNSVYPAVVVVGEVAEFNISQGKFAFFKLKDEKATISCFMMAFKMTSPLENGMKIRVLAQLRVRDVSGALSLNVAKYQPVGEGSIKKALELLKMKLQKEGLFDAAKKRKMPEVVRKIAVISSMDAAGYRDFIKILGERAGGLEIEVANTAVQGINAPEGIIRALQRINECAEADIIAIVRGGGSKDDLSAFNDEALARAIRASRIPVLVGVGHEVDESIADLVADVRASTPTHAAQLLTPRDKRQIVQDLHNLRAKMASIMLQNVRVSQEQVRAGRGRIESVMMQNMRAYQERIGAVLGRVEGIMLQNIQGYAVSMRTILEQKMQEITREVGRAGAVLAELNPEKVLARGYAIIGGKIKVGEVLKITTSGSIIISEVKEVNKR